MSMGRNKLVSSISAEQLQEFLDELAQTAGVNGPMIQQLAEQRFGVEIGHNSANHFRKEVYNTYLEKLGRRKGLAKMVAEHADDGSGRKLADAASDELSQQVFEFLAEAELDLSNEDDLERAEALSRIIKSARSEDRKLVTQLLKQVEEMRSQADAAKKLIKAQGGLSEEAVAAIEDTLNFRKPVAA